MQITLETDYAIRIVDRLARHSGRMGAQAISGETGVTLRFSLKILRKLVGSGIVRSYKGAQGGYEIARPPAEISVNDILETIEGPYVLSRCLRGEQNCSHDNHSYCSYHYLFEHISDQVRQQLREVTLDHIIQGNKQAID